MLKKMKPYHVLSFATGATAIPAGGWPSRPRIYFKHDSATSYVKASTCALKLVIPVTTTNMCLTNFLFVMAYSLAHGATFSDI